MTTTEATVEQYQSVANKAAEAVGDLMLGHFPTILRKKDEDAKIDVTFKITLRGEPEGGYSLVTNIGYNGSKVSDDREDYIDPPGQGKLVLDEM